MGNTVDNKKRIYVGLIANLVAMFVSLGVSFLLTPYLISNIGKEGYSFFPMANDFVGYMNVLSLALNSMASRFITISLASKRFDDAQKYFSTVFFANIILCLILLLPMMIIVLRFDRFINVPNGMLNDIRKLLTLMFVSLLIQLMFSVFGVATFATERMDLYAYQSIGLNVLRATLFVIFFKTMPVTISIMGVVSLIISIYNGFIQISFSHMLLPEFKINKEYFDISCLRELLFSGIWNSLNYLGMVLVQMITILMANVLISVSASGDISIVQVFPNLMTTIISSVYGVLLPRIANVYASKDVNEIIYTVKHSQKILGMLSTIPTIIIILFGKHFFKLWVPNEDSNYLHIISIITILPLLIHSSMWTVYGLNLMNNKVKWPAIVFIIFGCLNIILTRIIIKNTNFGVIGIVSISSLFSIVYYTLFLPIYTSFKMNIDKMTFYPHIIKTLIFSFISCVASFNIIESLSIHSWIEFFIYALVFSIVIEFLYIMVIFSRKEKLEFIMLIKENICLKR